VRLLFVGINPGVRSALTGHHFAGFSNRFWKLLWEARLVPEPISFQDDVRLPEWGIGITNLIARPTPGIDTLHRDEYVEGVRVLRRKLRRWRPAVVALVGLSVARAIFGSRAGPIAPGPWPEPLDGARVFVLPNPSGRNAHFRYEDMLRVYRRLSKELSTRRPRKATKKHRESS
jgi:TDG/mug DNA glycosylase family protein